MTSRDVLTAHAASTDDAVLVLGRDGDVVFANPGVLAIFGEPPVTRAADIAARLDLAGGRDLRFDHTPERIEARRRDGGPWLDVAVYPLTRSAITGGGGLSIVVARDVTSRRRAGDLREAFASIVSHELRTPVTTIYGGAQLLADTRVSEQTRSDAAAAVVQEAERLYRLIDDLVILARFDQPLAAADEPVLLQRFLPALVAEEAGRIPGRVRVRVPESLPAVVGRQGYVEQVVRHLAAMGLRFSPRDQALAVTARRRLAEVEVTVVDSGAPIEAADAAQLFNLFHHSARTAPDSSGANMGLFVCRRLVEAMGGRIWARARNGHGVETGFALRVAEGEDVAV